MSMLMLVATSGEITPLAEAMCHRRGTAAPVLAESPSVFSVVEQYEPFDRTGTAAAPRRRQRPVRRASVPVDQARSERRPLLRRRFALLRPSAFGWRRWFGPAPIESSVRA